MYSVDKNDRVVEYTDLPPMETGAPSPRVYGDESRVRVAYLLQNPEALAAYRAHDIDTYLATKSRCALSTFSHVLTHRFGWPNVDVLNAHPLYSRGLRSYGMYEVKQSSWIRQLEEANSIHPMHRKHPSWLDKYRHFIITFHDNTFECIAREFDFKIVEDPAEELKKSISFDA